MKTVQERLSEAFDAEWRKLTDAKPGESVVIRLFDVEVPFADNGDGNKAVMCDTEQLGELLKVCMLGGASTALAAVAGTICKMSGFSFTEEA